MKAETRRQGDKVTRGISVSPRLTVSPSCPSSLILRPFFAILLHFTNHRPGRENLMKWITLVLCAIVAMIVVACGDATRTTNSPAPSAAQSPAATTASATPDQFAAARAGYAKNCLGCHGETGEGGTKKVEGKTLKVPSFKAPHSLKDSDKEFMEQIHEGGEGMPAFKDKLSEAEMTDLVKFIRKEFQGK